LRQSAGEVAALFESLKKRHFFALKRQGGFGIIFANHFSRKG
jgi:hypothetical protein